jgi:hypothetical protein
MKNQISAIVIASIMRFYLGTSLIIISSSHGSGMMSFFTHLFIYIAACFYGMKIKLCPDIKSHLLLTIIETTIGIAVIEFLMGVWCSVENVIVRVVKCGLSDDVKTDKAAGFADMITMGLAACVLLSVVIDGQLVEKAMAYYYKNMQGPKCPPMPKNCAPQQQRVRPQNGPMFRNPNCPCHGDNVMRCER